MDILLFIFGHVSLGNSAETFNFQIRVLAAKPNKSFERVQTLFQDCNK